MLIQHIKEDIKERIKNHLLQMDHSPGTLKYEKQLSKITELQEVLKIIEKCDNLQPGMFS